MKVKILLKSKVNISQLFKILPFVCVILLSGCSVLEETEGFISSQNTTNKDAARFIKTINNQPDQLSLYRNLLADYQPMYDLVKMKYGSEHGMYYFVPYCEPVSAEVKGAIYYPVEYSIDEDDKVTLKDILKSPKLVNADAINNKIPITQRFLYSHSFAELMGQGQKVDEDLLSYEFLNGSVMKIDNESDFRTRSSYCGSNYVKIEFFYEPEYIGQKNDAIYGLSVKTLFEYTRDALRRLGFHSYSNSIPGCLIEHSFTKIEMIVEISAIDRFYAHNMDTGNIQLYESFVWDFLQMLSYVSRIHDFMLYLDYTYAIYMQKKTNDGGGYSVVGEVLTGGSSGESSHEEIISSNEEEKDFEQNCDDIPNAKNVKDEFRSSIDALYKAKETKIGQKSYVDFSKFTDAIKDNGQFEYGIGARDFGDGNLYIDPVRTDYLNNTVGIDVGEATVFTLHNHPNQTPPSARDLRFLAEVASVPIYTKFKFVGVYTDQNDTFYGLVITDREKAIQLFNTLLKDEIDLETNDFKKGGICDKILSADKSLYKNMSINNSFLARLSIIINKLGGGVSIVEYKRKKDNSLIVYDVNRSKELIKCE